MDRELAIPQEILGLCQRFAQYTTPTKRYSGFQETSTQKRGDGDLTDMIGSMMVFDLLAKNNVKCSIDITSGTGDDYDLVIFLKNKPTLWNVKTSVFHPFRKNLNLFVKQEEITKKMHGFIQVFVHLEETDEPHVHVSGFVPVGSPLWLQNQELAVIPRTGGHKGLQFPVDTLMDVSVLIKKADKKI